MPELATHETRWAPNQKGLYAKRRTVTRRTTRRRRTVVSGPLCMRPRGSLLDRLSEDVGGGGGEEGSDAKCQHLARKQAPGRSRVLIGTASIAAAKTLRGLANGRYLHCFDCRGRLRLAAPRPFCQHRSISER